MKKENDKKTEVIEAMTHTTDLEVEKSKIFRTNPNWKTTLNSKKLNWKRK
jgi:hypothetical protein